MGQSLLRVKNRSKTCFKINNAVSTQVFRLFVGDALKRFFRLHYRNCVSKALQIFRQASLIRSAKEPLGKSIGVGSWKTCILSVFS